MSNNPAFRISLAELFAKRIYDTGRIFNDVSFSFMNLGKLSHESCES